MPTMVRYRMGSETREMQVPSRVEMGIKVGYVGRALTDREYMASISKLLPDGAVIVRFFENEKKNGN